MKRSFARILLCACVMMMSACSAVQVGKTAYRAPQSPVYQEILLHVEQDMLYPIKNPEACAQELFETRQGKEYCKDTYAALLTKEEWDRERAEDEQPVLANRDGKRGTLRIPSFGEYTAEDFENKVRILQNEGVELFVVDLRDNLGGFVQSALGVLYLFAKPGDRLVTFRYRGGREEIRDTTFVAREYGVAAPPGAFRGIAIDAVWVNMWTASSAEIVAGVLQEWGYSIVGSQTYGKGIGQDVFELQDGSYLVLTTFECFLGNAQKPLHGIGVHPNKNK